MFEELKSKAVRYLVAALSGAVAVYAVNDVAISNFVTGGVEIVFTIALFYLPVKWSFLRDFGARKGLGITGK